MKRRRWRALHAVMAAVSLSLAPLVVQAAIDCTGTVTNLSLQMGTAGTVTLSLSNGPTYTYFCNVGEGNLNGVSPSVCRTMYATLLTAKATNKQVLIRFYDHDSCTAVPSWANAGALGWTKVLLD